MKKYLLFAFFTLNILAFTFNKTNANELTIKNITLTEKNTTNGYIKIQFDISWKNSFRVNADPEFWDAAWVFVKFRDSIGGNWKHATLSFLSNEHTAPEDAVINAAEDGKGLFIYRKNEGTGDVSWRGIKAKWEYRMDRISDSATVELQMIGIEMVYVPDGAFYIGDGASEGTFRKVTANAPARITDKGIVIKCENTSYDDSQLEGKGIYVDGDDGIGNNETEEVTNMFYPTGYLSYYCMKYEITQQQYTDFLNLLTEKQAYNRWQKITSHRYGITGSYPEFETNSPHVACNFLSWMDGVAYADWAGLRPMSELEYEKACRGMEFPVKNEYAWGTAEITTSSYKLQKTDKKDEFIENDTFPGNASYAISSKNYNAPIRVGIFAKDSTTRQQSGATYYGIMEMTGNLYERVVTLGNETGRLFAGDHGDGALTEEGFADVENWPGLVEGKVINAQGSGLRGGYWYLKTEYLGVSVRDFAAFGSDSKAHSHGFRAVRFSP